MRELIAKGALVYVSPALTMYLNDTAEESQRSNYSISRFVWSLKNHPAANTVRATWSLYIPLHALADAMIAAGRDKSAVEIASGLGNPAQVLLNSTAPIADFSSTTSGAIEAKGRVVKQKPDSVTSLAKFGIVPLDRSFPESAVNDSGLPPYFTL